MSAPVLMPQLGESVFEGTVVQWLVARGAPVAEGEPLLRITTDKLETEIPAPTSGILLAIHVLEGQTVAKGTVLAEIGEGVGEGEPASAPARQGAGLRDRPRHTPLAQHLAAAPGFISPAVARLAERYGVDLTRVIGTGANGRISKKDVISYVAAHSPSEAARRPLLEGVVLGDEGSSAAMANLPSTSQPEAAYAAAESSEADGETEIRPLSPLRLSAAHHLVASIQAAPQVTTVMEADLTRVVQARERWRGELAGQGVRLAFTPFFVQAIVAGLKAVPEANSSLRGDMLCLYKRFHIGIAVALPDGLVVPVIHDADKKSLLELATAVNDLAERARSHRLSPADLQGGTFTLTNHGTAGSLWATPILVPPQVGILGVGAIHKRPVVISRAECLLPDIGDVLAIRPMVYLSFTFDHRVLDGQGADHFLVTVKYFLEGYAQ